jgi:hypothetical protein
MSPALIKVVSVNAAPFQKIFLAPLLLTFKVGLVTVFAYVNLTATILPLAPKAPELSVTALATVAAAVPHVPYPNPRDKAV